MGALLARASHIVGVAVFPVVAIAVVAGVSVFAIRTELDTWSALALGMGTGFVGAGAVTWMRELASRRVRRREEAAAVAVRREAAFRLFWEASADFMADGWGRGDLETLRLLCLNLAPGEPLNDRVARRLRDACSAVLAGVIDRLGDVALTARDIDTPESHVAELERATGVLVQELEGSNCNAGESINFDARRVADAADHALRSCERLRDDVRPRIVSDLGAIVSWLTRSNFADRVSAGEIRVHAPAAASARVAVRPSDLSQALDDLLGKIFSQGQVGGPVDVRVHQSEERTHLVVTWPIRNRFRLDPGALVKPLRVLTAYGATITLDESLEDGTISLEAFLPNAPGAWTAKDEASEARA